VRIVDQLKLSRVPEEGAEEKSLDRFGIFGGKSR
jgi:hypothetical protein